MLQALGWRLHRTQVLRALVGLEKHDHHSYRRSADHLASLSSCGLMNCFVQHKHPSLFVFCLLLSLYFAPTRCQHWVTCVVSLLVGNSTVYLGSLHIVQSFLDQRSVGFLCEQRSICFGYGLLPAFGTQRFFGFLMLKYSSILSWRLLCLLFVREFLIVAFLLMWLRPNFFA